MGPTFSGLSFFIWKGWETREALETHLPAMSQRSGETMGVSLLPSPQAARLGSVQLALAGCQSPGVGHQLVGAEALELLLPVKLYL